MARKSRRQVAADNCANVSRTDSKTWRVGAYLRLSCDDTKKRGDSLETQRNIIENYIAAMPDMCLAGAYTDNNATGTNFDRPGFQQILADAHSGQINCIIVKDLSRFGRNAIDAGYYIERVFPSIGVRFIAVTDSFDSQDNNGGLLLPLKNIISESYALDISRKVRAVQQHNIQEGRFIGRLAPYGYQKDPDDCHKLIPDEETAPVVRRIFEWAMQGATAGEIARRLCAEGIPSPSHHNHAKGYNTSEKLLGLVYWKTNTIKAILTDRVYVGDMVQGKTKIVRGKQVDIPPSEWVCVPDTHSPLVSREVFDRVQTLREEIRQKSAAIQTKPHTPNLLKGKVFCAHCGRSMHRQKQQGHEYYWFRCESQWKYGKNTCFQVSIKESDIIESIWDTIQHHSDRFRSIEQTDGNSTLQSELKSINRKLGENGRYLQGLYESLADGLVSPDEYRKMKEDYQVKIEALSARADDIRNALRDAEMQKARQAEISDAATAIHNGRISAEIMEHLIDKILVRRDKSFDVQYRFEEAL